MTVRDTNLLLEGYNTDKLSLGALGSHSALDVCQGAQSEGIPNFVIAKKGRHKTYTKAFKERKQGARRVGSVQDIFLVDNWKEMLGDEVIYWIRGKMVLLFQAGPWQYICGTKNPGAMIRF